MDLIDEEITDCLIRPQTIGDGKIVDARGQHVHAVVRLAPSVPRITATREAILNHLCESLNNIFLDEWSEPLGLDTLT